MPSRTPPPEPEGPAYVDDDHQRIAEFAEDFLEDDERDEFIDHLMERRGYQRVSSWGPRSEQPDPEPGPEPQRQRGRQGGGQQRRSGYFKR